MDWPKKLQSVKSTSGRETPELYQVDLPPSVSGPVVGTMSATQEHRERRAHSLAALMVDVANDAHGSIGKEIHVNNLIWIVGAVVIILFILGFLGLR